MFHPSPDVSAPRWNGGDVGGRTVLLHAACDPRDAVRWLRFARLVRQAGSRVFFAGDEELTALAGLCPSIYQTVSWADVRSGSVSFDRQMALEELAAASESDPVAITAGLPYLKLPGDVLPRRAESTALRVEWAFEELTLPEDAASASQIEIVRTDVDTALCERALAERPWPERVARLAELDLLVTGDTLYAQVAAAVGVAVWMILPDRAGPPWLGPASTPWHPTLRVFRGSAADVLESVRTGLPAAVDQRILLRAAHRYSTTTWRPSVGERGTSVPAVSVVMPVWNAAHYLRRAIDSLLLQTCGDWELLAVDDGSTDYSWDILLHAAQADSRIIPLRLDRNRGPAAARNVGLGKARGTWIAYLDSDDEFHPMHLARFAGRRIEGDVLVFAYDVRNGSPDGITHVESVWDPVFKRDRLCIRNPATPLGVVHRRELLEQVGLFDERVCYQEDWGLWRRMADAGAQFRFSPERSGRYHVRPDGQSRTRRVPEALR